MSDDQAEPLEQPELLSVAEVLTEHATAVRSAAFDRWSAPSPIPEGFGPWLRQLATEAHAAGWRAALEWYIGLGPARQLAEVIDSQLGARPGIADLEQAWSEWWPLQPQPMLASMTLPELALEVFTAGYRAGSRMTS